ncbi:hypothetical protein SNEBB_009430 [Seison nebaliae]|nr:hypothetical protein SNEBB_009430 [Seison nebaliae]
MVRGQTQNVKSFLFGDKSRLSSSREILRLQSSHLESEKYTERPSSNDELSFSNTQWQRSRKKIFPIIRLDNDPQTTQYPPLTRLVHTAEEENIYREIKQKQLNNNSSTVHDVYEDIIMPKCSLANEEYYLDRP